jgi:hypothetical protein
MKDPSTAVASTMAQQMQWNTMNKEKRIESAAALKEHINQQGVVVNSLLGIQDPTLQKEAIIKTVSNLTPQEQEQYMAKYGKTPEEWQQNLPHTMNDLIVTDKGIDYLAQLAQENRKHDYKIEEVGVKNDFASQKQLSQNQFTAGQNALNRENRTSNASKDNGYKEEVAKDRVELSRQRNEDMKARSDDISKQQRMKNVENYMKNIPNYNDLSSEDQDQLKSNYIETGKTLKIKKEAGKYFGNNYSIESLKNNDIPTTQNNTSDPLGLR